MATSSSSESITELLAFKFLAQQYPINHAWQDTVRCRRTCEHSENWQSDRGYQNALHSALCVYHYHDDSCVLSPARDFIRTPHQPPPHPCQRSESSLTPSTYFAILLFYRSVLTRSDSGKTKLPPLPPRKLLASPIHRDPPMIVAPLQNTSYNRIDRSRSPSKLVYQSSFHHPNPATLSFASHLIQLLF